MDTNPPVTSTVRVKRPVTPQLELRENAWFSVSLGMFVQGASYLLGGAPGSRKSGLAAQLALDLARQGKGVLFIPTEEPAKRVWERWSTMMADFPAADVTKTMAHLRVEENPPMVDQLPAYVSRQILATEGVHHLNIAMVIVDSVQGHGLVSAATRAYDRLLEATRLLSASGITTLLVNHLTKRGELAGPRTLEHGVDAVLLLRKTPACRLLFTLKNRFGPASLSEPVALVLDPTTLRLTPSALALPIVLTAKTYLGAGLGGLVDLQAGVSLAGPGMRGRLTAPNLPKREVEQLVECLGRMHGFELDDLSFRISARLPGRNRYSSSAGLALAIALLGSYLQLPIPPSNVYLGEVDLGRSIRKLDNALANQLVNELDSGTELSGRLRFFAHPATVASIATNEHISVVPCENLEQAMYATWPSLR